MLIEDWPWGHDRHECQPRPYESNIHGHLYVLKKVACHESGNLLSDVSLFVWIRIFLSLEGAMDLFQGVAWEPTPEALNDRVATLSASFWPSKS
jgi:hypothetical protein